MVMQAPHQTEDWTGLLKANPNVLWGLVADVVKAVKASEGERRTGRRPAASVASLDELYDVLFPPSYHTAPFPQALHHVLVETGRSQRALARETGINQSTIARLVAGSLPPSVEMMERIAHTVNVRPTYFSEYRAMKLGQHLTDYLMANPGASAEAVRRLFGAPA